MYYSMVSAEYVDGYRICVGFEDGHSGVADLEPYIRRGGVFAPLAELGFFQQFKINRDFGVLCWGDEIDIAPESIYEQVVGPVQVRKVAEEQTRYGQNDR